MKVKEAYSNEFKSDGEEKILKESNEYTLREKVCMSGEHRYSTYSFYIDKRIIFLLAMPDPLNSNALEKNFYLKYQNATGSFLKELFDFFIQGDKSFLVRYFDKQEPDLTYKIIGNMAVFYIGETEVGFIDLGDLNKSIKLAENFISLFSGQELKYDWDEIK